MHPSAVPGLPGGCATQAGIEIELAEMTGPDPSLDSPSCHLFSPFGKAELVREFSMVRV